MIWLIVVWVLGMAPALVVSWNVVDKRATEDEIGLNLIFGTLFWPLFVAVALVATGFILVMMPVIATSHAVGRLALRFIK